MLSSTRAVLSILCLVLLCWIGIAQAQEAVACDCVFTSTPAFAPMCAGALQTKIFTIKNNAPITMPFKYIKVFNVNGSPNASATIGTAPSNNCGTSLRSGASCNIAVNLLPGGAEEFSLILEVGLNSTQGRVRTPITLSATAGCNVSFNLPLPVFTDTCSNVTEEQTFTITNNTLTSLPIGTIQFQNLPGDTFAGIVAEGTPTNQCITGNFINAGDSCNIEVDIDPTAGPFSGTINRNLLVDINNVTLGTPISLEVLSGCDFIFSPPLPLPVNMACDVLQSLIFIVKNNTGLPGTVSPILTINTPPDTLPGAAVLNSGASTCAGIIAAGASCNLVVDLSEDCTGGVSGLINATLTANTTTTGIITAPVINVTVTVPPPPPPPPINYLGDAGLCAVLGGSTVTNTGASLVTNGHVCLSPGPSITGFPPGLIVNGTLQIGPGIASAAQAALGIAITTLTGLPCTTGLSGQDLGGLAPLAEGVYCFNTSAQLTGTVTLTGNSNSVFVFQIGSALTTASAAQVVLVGVDPANVYWVMGTAATVGTFTLFQGNLLVGTSITMNTGASLLNGRALAQAAVTLDTNAITKPP